MPWMCLPDLCLPSPHTPLTGLAQLTGSRHHAYRDSGFDALSPAMCSHCACGLPDQAPDQSPSLPRSLSPARRVVLQQSLLAQNDHLAAHNREHFRAAGVRVVNLLSSPGSGKTALLERLAATVSSTLRLGALVGDLATDHDARRLEKAGLPAVQITTGHTCHLDAAMVHRGLAALESAGHPLAALDLLLIENVGNLVCPAVFDLGEDLRLVLLSVTEGEDKPLKYPATFQSADLVVITKVDLADAVGFDRLLAHHHVRQVAPGARVLETSARSGEGMGALLEMVRPSPQTVLPQG